ncbi:MAG: cytochrome C biogenesis protein, partial [Proteobacteria bacterium]
MTVLQRLPVWLALILLTLASWPGTALAVTEADLLPVDQAFVLEASAPSRDRIEVKWKVADGYYLYRHRIDVQVEGPDFQAGKIQLPKGKAHRDEFFGDVETYHQDLVGKLDGKASDGANSVILRVKYQGCADAGICYPPQTRKLSVKLPAAAGEGGLPATTASANTGLPLFGPAMSTSSGATDALPLPQDQAFAFEAIAYDGNQLLLRLTPAPGYYLYRDRTTMKLEGAPGVSLDSPRWPKGDSHRDEHFGQVTVYFAQAEVP